jgi:hypothetical protein
LKEWLAGKVKWILGSFIGLMLFLVFVLPQFWPAYSDYLDHLFANISVKATPAFAIPSTTKNTIAYHYNPLKIQVIDWINVKITWPNITGASEYMLRAAGNEYPGAINSGDLVYSGNHTLAYDQRGSNIRYTLFYKNATDTWVTVYRGHVEGQ